MQVAYIDFGKETPLKTKLNPAWESATYETHEFSMQDWQYACSISYQKLVEAYVKSNPWHDLAKGYNPPEWKKGQSKQLPPEAGTTPVQW